MKLRSVLNTSAALGLFLALAQGCILVIDFDPIGSDATVEGSWTIDGAPATAATCAALDIDRVRIAFYDGSTAFYADTLEAPCSAGRIDTRPTARLAAGTYTVRFEAFRGNMRVGEGNMQTIVARVGGHVTLLPADFVGGTTFNPIGTDATVEGSWTIEGATPSTANCSTLGIDTVRIAFYNGATAFYDTTLETACSAGVMAPLDPILRAGTYTVRFEAFRGTERVGEGNMQTIVATAGGHVTLSPADFVGGGSFNPLGSDASLELAWTLNGQMPTADTCYAVGVETVRIIFYAPSDTAFAAGVIVDMAPCMAGRIDRRPMRTVRAGEYVVAVESLGETGGVIDREVQGTITVPGDAHIVLTPVPYDFGTTLTIQMDWAMRVGGAPATCADAGVSTIGYQLRREGTVVASAEGVPCGELITFDTTKIATFGGGNYTFYFDGAGLDGIKNWQVQAGSPCSAISLSNGGIAFRGCLATYRP